MKTQLFLDLQESGSAPAPPTTLTPASAPAAPPKQPASASVSLQQSAPATTPTQQPAPATTPPQQPTPATAPPTAAKPAVARGAADAAAVPRRRPAVWQGPGAQRADSDAAMQRADAGTMQRAPDTAARGLGVAIESWADRAAQSRPATPAAAPRVPQPGPAFEAQALPARPARQDEMLSAPVSGPAPVQAPGHARPDLADFPRPETPPRPHGDVAPAARSEPFPDDVTIPRSPSALDEADWLATRRSVEPTQRKASAWNRFRQRRLAAWSIAGGLLAGLAAGGVWLYAKNRVDGAPVVAAATAPARTASAPVATGARAPAAPQAVAPASTPAVPPVAATDIVQPVPAPVAAAAVPASPAPVDVDRTVRTVETVTPPAADVEPPKRAARQPVTARKRPAPKAPRARPHDTAPAARVATEPSARQRREELLMQCRAHGYDERRCFQRACTMTRYGLVCRG